MASEDCDYLPSRYMDLSAGRYGDAGCSDGDWEVDSVSSDDSSSAIGTRRKRKQTSMGVRKPTGGSSGGGGGSGGGPRVLHRWTAEEHARLEALVRQYGTERNWALIAEGIRGRSGKQCRERWLNHMREGIIKGNWLADEEFHLALCHMLVGNQWSLHCNRLRGRTENSIKNYWNATMRSKQPNKRRGFLWAYIDRVKVALDDEALRHQALADTVAIVYGQTNDWLPAWLRARITAGELELPRVGEALGRGWRRLLDRELAFLRGRDTGAAAASIGGIPYPNPASIGAALPLLPAAPKPAARRQATGHPVQRPPRLQARERLEAQPLYNDPGPASPSLLQVQAPGGPALGQQLQQGPQRAPSLGLDPLGDVMMLGDAPSYPGPEAAFVAAGVAAGSCVCDAAARDVGAAGTAGGAPGAGGAYSAGDKSEDGDDEDELLVEELPDAMMPDGGEAPSRAIVAPGLPRLVVTAPQGAWWGGGAGGVSLAAAVAAAAAGLGAPDSAVAAANGGASPPPLSRDSSFCGSAGSTGATPTMSRLRLASNSPAPPQPPPSVMLAGGAFGTTCAAAGAGGAGATPAPALVGPAIGLRPYQPSHLSASASDFSSGSALMLQPAWLMGAGAAGVSQPSLCWAGTALAGSSAPGLLYEALPALQLPLQLPPPLLQQLVDLAAPQPVGANDAARASPFSSPHAQGGEAFGAQRPSTTPAAACGPASAPPAFGGLPAAAPLLSRFAVSGRRTCGGGSPSYPAGFGAPPNEAPLPWDAYTAAPLLQPPLRRSSADSSATMPTVIASTREPAAGCEVRRQTASHCHGGAELEAAHGAVPSLDAPGNAGAAHAPCFGSVGSGSNGCAAACDGAGPIPSRMHVSGSLGFLSSASLSALAGADSTLLLMDGQALSSLDGFPNAVDGSNGACGPTDA